MHCSLFQENIHLSNIIFNNQTDRHHYSALLKENLQKSSVKEKRKLIDRDSKQVKFSSIQILKKSEPWWMEVHHLSIYIK